MRPAISIEEGATLVCRLVRAARDLSAAFPLRRSAIKQLGEIANDSAFPEPCRQHATAAIDLIAAGVDPLGQQPRYSTSGVH